MKASRITAVGLVAAAALWIASGHLLPRESAEGQAAIRPAEQKVEAPSFATLRALPLCRWPAWPHYKSGPVTEASSFTCAP